MVFAAENKIHISSPFLLNLHGGKIPMISFPSLFSTNSFPHLSSYTLDLFLWCQSYRCYSFFVAVIRGRDPSAVMVMLEDGAAVAGVMLATGCLGLTSYTGSPVFDAMGSIMIGGNGYVIGIKPKF